MILRGVNTLNLVRLDTEKAIFSKLNPQRWIEHIVWQIRIK